MGLTPPPLMEISIFFLNPSLSRHYRIGIDSVRNRHWLCAGIIMGSPDMTTRLQLTWRGAAGGDEASPRLHQPPPRREVILGLQREVAEPAGGHLLPPEQQEQLVSVAHTVVLHRGRGL